MYTEKVMERIQVVLDSGLTPYRIAKELGYSSANTVHALMRGGSNVPNIRLEYAAKYEKIYEDLQQMTRIEVKTKDKTIYVGGGLQIQYGFSENEKFEPTEVAHTNDMPEDNVVYFWKEPELEVRTVEGNEQQVAACEAFDVTGELYEIVWLAEGVETIQELRKTDKWLQPNTVTKVQPVK